MLCVFLVIFLFRKNRIKYFQFLLLFVLKFFENRPGVHIPATGDAEIERQAGLRSIGLRTEVCRKKYGKQV